MDKDFSLHQHSAHCESGVISTLLKNADLDISEAMAFGLSSSLAFAYLPIIKIGGQALIAYRMPPGHIIKKLCKRLGVKLVQKRFRQEQAGLTALDQALSEKRVVGLQTSVFFLPYFPDDMRFHFNAHNLMVYAKQDNEYLISDPVFEKPVSCMREDLQKARFARGALAAKGLMYYPENVPSEIDFRKAIKQALRDTTRIMDGLPLPFMGIRGIRYLGKKIAGLKEGPGREHSNRLYLGHIVRMQEEIGTGGAGFRFIYASFLQECSVILNNDSLLEVSALMTDTGDLWREFATKVVMYCKGRGKVSLKDLQQAINVCADSEQVVIDRLKSIYPSL